MMKIFRKRKSIILGIGNDILEIDRVRKSIEEHGDLFLNKLFTEKEIEYCKKHKDYAKHFTGRFSVKESISKALGIGFGKILSWKDLEILPNKIGKPELFLTRKIDLDVKKTNILISISHCHNYVSTVAIWVADN